MKIIVKSFTEQENIIEIEEGATVHALKEKMAK